MKKTALATHGAIAFAHFNFGGRRDLEAHPTAMTTAVMLHHENKTRLNAYQIVEDPAVRLLERSKHSELFFRNLGPRPSTGSDRDASAPQMIT
jgi:hypothetical protein